MVSVASAWRSGVGVLDGAGVGVKLPCAAENEKVKNVRKTKIMNFISVSRVIMDTPMVYGKTCSILKAGRATKKVVPMPSWLSSQIRPL